MYICTPSKCKLKRVGQDTLPFSEKPNMSEKEYIKPVLNAAINNNNNVVTRQQPYTFNRGHRNNNNNNQPRTNRIRYHHDLDNPVQ